MTYKYTTNPVSENGPIMARYINYNNLLATKKKKCKDTSLSVDMKIYIFVTLCYFLEDYNLDE